MILLRTSSNGYACESTTMKPFRAEVVCLVEQSSCLVYSAKCSSCYAQDQQNDEKILPDSIVYDADLCGDRGEQSIIVDPRAAQKKQREEEAKKVAKLSTHVISVRGLLCTPPPMIQRVMCPTMYKNDRQNDSDNHGKDENHPSAQATQGLQPRCFPKPPPRDHCEG